MGRRSCAGGHQKCSLDKQVCSINIPVWIVSGRCILSLEFKKERKGDLEVVGKDLAFEAMKLDG